MVESLQVSAQLTTVVEVDLTKVARLRARAKSEFERREGVKLSYLPFLALAAVEALKAHPNVNASVEGDEIVYHGQENLAIAVDTEKGLLVPVVKNAGDLNIAGLARAIADLADRTRNNKIAPDDLAGGTFTITNTGSRGALFDTPIINQPQVAILGTGALVKRPVVVADADGGETIAVRSMMYLALSYDHRIVDGADAARFLGAMKTRLEEGPVRGLARPLTHASGATTRTCLSSSGRFAISGATQTCPGSCQRGGVQRARLAPGPPVWLADRMSQRVAISGASGLIGSALSSYLVARGDDVRHLVRREARTGSEISWDPAQRRLDAGAFEDVDAVVHLAGAGVGRPPVVTRLQAGDPRLPHRRHVDRRLGRRGPRRPDPAGQRLGGRVVRQRPRRRDPHRTEPGGNRVPRRGRPGVGGVDRCRQPVAGAPVAMSRTGLVMSRKGGAFEPLVRLGRLGLAGPLGSGRQWWPWISLDDVIRALVFLVDRRDILGTGQRRRAGTVAPEADRRRDRPPAGSAHGPSRARLRAPGGARGVRQRGDRQPARRPDPVARERLRVGPRLDLQRGRHDPLSSAPRHHASRSRSRRTDLGQPPRAVAAG